MTESDVGNRVKAQKTTATYEEPENRIGNSDGQPPLFGEGNPRYLGIERQED